MTADAILERAQQLPLTKQLRLFNGDSAYSQLSDQDRAYVDSYCVYFSTTRAAGAAKSAPKRFKNELVERAIVEQLALKSAEHDLNADYVREYIRDALELCPTDYFLLGVNGEWMIDPVAFKQLPKSIKRLVDGVELKVVQGQAVFKVNFISKQVALAMAAKYTLTQKVEAKVATTQIPWEQIAGPLESSGASAIERKIAELEPVQGPLQAEGAPVAPVRLLQQTGGDSPERLGQLQDGGAGRAQVG